LIFPSIFWKNERHRYFVLVNELIDKKISIEYILRNFSKTEILKSYLFNRDINIYNKKLNIQEHIAEIYNQ
jgi:hypothetical protein